MLPAAILDAAMEVAAEVDPVLTRDGDVPWVNCGDQCAMAGPASAQGLQASARPWQRSMLCLPNSTSAFKALMNPGIRHCFSGGQLH